MHNASQLVVLARARGLAIDVHALADRHQRRLTARAPALRAQMLRAADSIVLNIAEGAGTMSDRQFVHFLDIAIGSTNELEAQIDLALAIEAFPDSGANLRDRVVEVRKMAIGLQKYLKRRLPAP